MAQFRWNFGEFSGIENGEAISPVDTTVLEILTLITIVAVALR